MRNARYFPFLINSLDKRNINMDKAYIDQFQTLNAYGFVSEWIFAIFYTKNLRTESSKYEGWNCKVIKKTLL
jgi:hypothetical protein